jgi:hypothetical protein
MAAPDAAPRTSAVSRATSRPGRDSHRAVEIDARPAGVVLNGLIEQIDETVRRNVFGSRLRWIMVAMAFAASVPQLALILGWRAGFSLVFHVAPYFE